MEGVPEVSVEQMREVDRLMVEEYHVSVLQMMENAGRSLARASIDLFQPESVTVLAGQGNKFQIWDEDNWNAQRDAWMEEGLGDGPMLVELESLSL